MPEYVPSPHRIEIAQSFADQNHDNPEISLTLPELVIAAGNDSRYLGRALGHEGKSLGEGSPRHWFIVAPARAQYGMTSIEFGKRHDDMTGQPGEQARFDHELAIDQTVALNRRNPVVQTLFRSIGGFMIEAVRDSGDEFLAALEVRYSAQEDNSTLRWTQIIYSQALLRTQQVIKDGMKSDRSYSAWVQGAIKPEHKEDVAELMALSALSAARG